MLKRLLTIAALVAPSAALPLLSPAGAGAQEYPTKPIRLIVPFGAGSTTDVIARSLGNALSADLGQQIVVENRPGAGGTIGAAEAARAPGDGYTLVMGTVASHAVGPLTMQNVSYDPIADFEPISLLANAPAIMVAHRSVPASNLKELIDYVKQNPGISYASAGTGTTTHLAGEALKLQAGIEMTHVPYKAVGQAVTDVLSGHIKVMVYQVPALKAHIDAGSLKPIAATTAQRIPSLPAVETIAETYSGFDFSAWFGILAPAKTPKPVLERLHAAIVKAMNSPAVKQHLLTQGLEPSGIGPDEFKALMQASLPKWREIIAATGTKAQ